MGQSIKIALINPSLVVQRSDPFTTGIVYMPIGLAYIAAMMRSQGIEPEVFDAYGESPRQVRPLGEFSIYGLTPSQTADRVSPSSTAVFVYANSLTNHIAILEIIRQLKKTHPGMPVVVLENTQAVTAYALAPVDQEFYKAGADFILTGEGESRALLLAQHLTQGSTTETLQAIDGLGGSGFLNPPVSFISNLDSLPSPAWDLFPLDSYWSIRHAHGPFETDRYLPLLTSRGCPYPCRFCVIPETNKRRWRARSAENVVDEMEAFVGRFGVREFHIEDVDPTISDTRIRQICEEILRRELRVIWKVAAGTKVESILDEETIDRMAEAGCRYISISPESGSERVLKRMDKPFDLKHAVRIVQRMNRAGIHSQACFVLGFPGETREELRMTWDLVRELTRVGVDEVALFIATPVPGSAIHPLFSGYRSLSQLSFSPMWRADFPQLNRFRLRLYWHFLFWKFIHHPLKMIRQPVNFLRRRFQTKMEMAPYRAMTATWLALRIGRSLPPRDPGSFL